MPVPSRSALEALEFRDTIPDGVGEQSSCVVCGEACEQRPESPVAFCDECLARGRECFEFYDTLGGGG